MCHSAAWFPGGFSQPFFRLNCKGFTHLHTQSEPNVPSKHKAAVGLPGPQRCFRHSQDAWRGRLRLKHSLPQFSNHGHFKPKSEKPVGRWGIGGGWVVITLIESRTTNPQPRHLGSWAYVKGLKEVLWAILEFAWGLFNSHNPQNSV